MVGMIRGADLLTQALSAAGIKRIFTVSGNQVMSIFDASIDADIELIHTRHEAAAVHMADALGRLTGDPGIALVTAGPGIANTATASYVAMMAESPVVVLSGQAESGKKGRGLFQEMDQPHMVDPVSKASWSVSTAEKIGADVVDALETAKSGRPGPVHLSLPVDLLESPVEQFVDLKPSDFQIHSNVGDDMFADQVLSELATAKKPIMLVGPAMMRGKLSDMLDLFTEITAIPVIGMESPRGINDPSLGAFPEVLSMSDLIVMVGKKLDFSLDFGRSPSINPDCSFIQIDSEQSVLDQTRLALYDSERFIMSQIAVPFCIIKQFVALATKRKWPKSDWCEEVQQAIAYRPEDWTSLESRAEGPIHGVSVGRAIRDLIINKDDVFISDGGEFGQWAQACVSKGRRIINGPSGSIGSAIPFAIASRIAFPQSRIVAALGDGTLGFHAMEFDTAVRYRLPFVGVIGNDATWNAEYQIQVRKYGRERLVGCELLPSRYDQMVSALGGHGELVIEPQDLRPTLDRALASNLPSCVNVMIGRNPAPVVRRIGR